MEELIKKGVEAHQKGDYKAARAFYLEAFKIAPKNFDVLNLLGIACFQLNEREAGKKYFNDAFLINPDINFIRQMAQEHSNNNDIEGAAFFYEKSLQLEPCDCVGLNNLGLLYEELSAEDAAKNCYEKSLKIKPNYEANYNLGVLLRNQKNFEKSIFYLNEALKFNPESFDANYSLAMTYFSIKEFYKGCPYYLKRKRKTPPLQNPWKGERHPDGAINVYAEGGFGDQIMFARYLPPLKQYFKEVRFLAPRNIAPIFNLEGIEICHDIKEADFDCSILDLPYYLKLDFSQIPDHEGLLKVNNKKAAQYKEKYFKTDKKKIGLCWQGNLSKVRSLKNRSIELGEFKKLFENKNCTFYSFQKDDFKNQIATYPDIINLAETFGDFSDTLAALANLDYMITIDTAMAHLAGCWGIKTFLLLPYASEWRWFDDEKQTPWYKSVEIFKQDKTNKWGKPIQNICKRINCKIS